MRGAGSSFAAPAILQWAADLEQVEDETANYQTSSSVFGLDDFARGSVDFGSSEIGYSTDQAQYVPAPGTYQYVPDVAGAECLMYNLKGRRGRITSLRLDSTALVKIFTGEITKWDQLDALDPGLPDTPILPVTRIDPSGDNYIFSQYLDTLQASTWNAFTSTLHSPRGAQTYWPTQNKSGPTGMFDLRNFVWENGSDTASEYVAGTSGSITYVETAYALEHGMPCASILNQGNAFVRPSPVADATALEKDTLYPDLEQNLTGVFTDTGPRAYPLSAYSYLVAPTSGIGLRRGRVLGDYIKLAVCPGQIQAAAVGYSPLPRRLVADDFAAIRRIHGHHDPGPVTPANCPNPALR